MNDEFANIGERYAESKSKGFLEWVFDNDIVRIGGEWKMPGKEQLFDEYSKTNS